MSTTLTIEDYAEEKRSKAKKVKAAIIERWNTRVVPRGLDKAGKAGASAYLDSYGKGISAPKVIDLAICAEAMAAPEMAAGFWEAAFNLETGQSATMGTGASGSSTSVTAPLARPQAPTLKGLPHDLQPGLVATMQPKDAEEPQSHYILSPNYVGQPKRDGCRNVLFATQEQSAHQSRSSSALAPVHPDFEEALKAAAKECGPFVLDCERYYRSVLGSEHRTSAQAATVNIEAGKGDTLPTPVIAVFKALFANGKDLRNATERERIEAASYPVAIIHSYLPENGPKIEILTTAITTAEKQALADAQKAEGREGEVWTCIDCAYIPGKSHSDSFRTKYVQEEPFTVIGATLSTAKGRTVASFEVADTNNKPVGSVGTGFDEATGCEILKAHEKNPGSVKILVKFQNFTESGALWHPRFVGMA